MVKLLPKFIGFSIGILIWLTVFPPWQDAPTPVPDCRVMHGPYDTSHLECREGYKPATYAQKQAFCREQWRQFLKPYRQSGRPPANAQIEGCEGVPEPRLTLEELEGP